MKKTLSEGLVPGFLVAVPQLRDPGFHRSVVLMLEHGEEGALGLILNKPSEASLLDVARSQELPVRPEMADFPVYFGGPVNPERGFVLHDRGEELEESVLLFDDVCVSASAESLKVLLEGPLDRFRLFLGYSGWGAGQIEKELQEGSWLTTEPGRRHIFGQTPDRVWGEVLGDMGIDPASLVMGGGLH